VSAQDGAPQKKQIDQYSFRLGSAAAFAEMVRFGNKKLALSSAVSPEEMEELASDLEKVVSEQGTLVSLETDLIVTDLFPADIAAGKHVMLIYKHETTRDEYLKLKKDKEALLRSGGYSGEARKDIARRFGRLLSYPESTVEEKIRSNTTTR